MNFNILLILTEQSKHVPPCPVWSLTCAFAGAEWESWLEAR